MSFRHVAGLCPYSDGNNINDDMLWAHHVPATWKLPMCLILIINLQAETTSPFNRCSSGTLARSQHTWGHWLGRAELGFHPRSVCLQTPLFHKEKLPMYFRTGLTPERSWARGWGGGGRETASGKVPFSSRFQFCCFQPPEMDDVTW